MSLSCRMSLANEDTWMLCKPHKQKRLVKPSVEWGSSLWSSWCDIALNFATNEQLKCQLRQRQSGLISSLGHGFPKYRTLLHIVIKSICVPDDAINTNTFGASGHSIENFVEENFMTKWHRFILFFFSSLTFLSLSKRKRKK